MRVWPSCCLSGRCLYFLLWLKKISGNRIRWLWGAGVSRIQIRRKSEYKDISCLFQPYFTCYLFPLMLRFQLNVFSSSSSWAIKPFLDQHDCTDFRSFLLFAQLQLLLLPVHPQDLPCLSGLLPWVTVQPILPVQHHPANALLFTRSLSPHFSQVIFMPLALSLGHTLCSTWQDADTYSKYKASTLNIWGDFLLPVSI